MLSRKTLSILFSIIGGLATLTVPLVADRAEDAAQKLPPPVTIVKGKMAGHTHPSVCRTRGGDLLVVYQPRDRSVLTMVRSHDSGLTWVEPIPIKVTAARPDFVPVTPSVQVYPGTLDTLPDGRLLLTWQYIARNPEKKFHVDPLLFSLSGDDGKTWTIARPFKSDDGYLDAVRQSVLQWSTNEWFLALREGPSVIYNTETGTTSRYQFAVSGKRPNCMQMVRTHKGTLLAMGRQLLRSTNGGKTWTAVPNFPGPPTGDNAHGRYLTLLAGGAVVLTWGEGRQNQGFRLNISTDDGLTWNHDRPLHRLPNTRLTAMFGSPRTVQLDNENLGTVYFAERGLFFVRTPLSVVGSEK